jgi:exodeoxyribonuclease VII large subunit
LRALSPYAVLDRGYAVAQRDDGTIVKDADHFKSGDTIRVRFSKSALTASVTETTKKVEPL